MLFKCIILSILFFKSYISFAQFGPQQIISSNADLAIKAIPVDVDGDGFMDVISASYLDGKIAWYRNLDGEGNFSEEIIISEELISIEQLLVVDVNGDDFKDLVYTTNLDDKIAWKRHLDGAGNFGGEQLISTGSYPHEIVTGDLDNDGDIDIVAEIETSGPENFLMVYINTDGLGTFAGDFIFDQFPKSSGDTRLADIDNDSDLDVISSFQFTSSDESMVWFENLGGLNFSFPTALFTLDFLVSDFTDIELIHPADVNNDGNIDLIFESQAEGVPALLQWSRNLGGEGNFDSPQIISDVGFYLSSIRSFDVDQDGDLDILASIFNPGAFVWVENQDGLGSFSTANIIYDETERATDINAAFIDGDTWPDIVTASSFDDTVAWYKNLGGLSVTDQQLEPISIYPNPSDGIVEIQSMTPIKAVEVFSVLGQSIKKLADSNVIDLTSLQTGIYFLKIQDNSGHIRTKRILIN